MGRSTTAGVYRAPRPRPERPSLELVPDLALRLFAALDGEPRSRRAPRAPPAPVRDTDDSVRPAPHPPAL